MRLVSEMIRIPSTLFQLHMAATGAREMVETYSRQVTCYEPGLWESEAVNVTAKVISGIPKTTSLFYSSHAQSIGRVMLSAS